jgi:HPt (histidine-containing phosphotransfer) domain-containing protein
MKGGLDEATRLRAVDSAHKLAGVLGTFGLPRGTDLAREAEVLFGEASGAGKEEVGRLQVLLAELTRLIEIGPLGPR